MEAKFCPFCQRKNKVDATRCAHCGVLLIAHKSGTSTTVGVSAGPAEGRDRQITCQDRITHLPPHSFALFVMDFEEPIILKNQPKIVIGRDSQVLSTASTLDMSRYGDLALGISRHHAQILYTDGVYSVEDLGSTNGTWLNRRRLTPGQAYPLRSDDQLWLGPLKLLVCLNVAEVSKQATFSLRLGNTLQAHPPYLTPDFLQSTIGPYLQAIDRLEEARAACLNLPPEPVYIVSIQESSEQIVIQLDGAGETMDLIKKWVRRWRDEHLEVVGTAQESQQPEQLLPLAERMVTYLQPQLSGAEAATLASPFIPSLATLVTSSLELVS